MKDRLTKFLSYLGIGQDKFARNVGLSRGYVNNLKDNITIKTVDKICAAYPELNRFWLLTGEGEMFKAVNTVGNIANSTVIGANVSGSGNTFHHKGGKDEMIQNQKEQLIETIELLYKEFQEFHKKIEQKDEQINRLIGIIEKMK